MEHVYGNQSAFMPFPPEPDGPAAHTLGRKPSYPREA